MKLITTGLMVGLLVLMAAVAAAEESSLRDPGILPDSPFYGIDTFLEQSNYPEDVLEYKEEKIAEARAMALENKTDYSTIALEQAIQYGKTLEKEITPKLEAEVITQSALITKALEEMSAHYPELYDQIVDTLDQEQQIRLAAAVASKIKQLCLTLAQLDPEEYATVCIAEEDSPQWQKDLDQELTQEQREHALLFAEKMKQCIRSQGAACDCKGMKVQSFEELCIMESTNAAQCHDGDSAACAAMMQSRVLRPEDYLPDYLLPVMKEVSAEMQQSLEQDYQDEYVQFGPGPCKDARLTTVPACQEYMDQNFPRTAEGAYLVDQKVGSMSQPAVESGKDCLALPDLTDKGNCLEQFYTQARQSFTPEFVIQNQIPEDWVSPLGNRWLLTENREERESIIAEIEAELHQRGFEGKVEVEGNRIIIEYRDELGREFLKSYWSSESTMRTEAYPSGSPPSMIPTNEVPSIEEGEHPLEIIMEENREVPEELVNISTEEPAQEENESEITIPEEPAAEGNNYVPVEISVPEENSSMPEERADEITGGMVGVPAEEESPWIRFLMRYLGIE